MKITFLLPFAGISGGVRVVAVYADQLRRRGHEVTVVSLPHWLESRRALIKDFFTRRLAMKARGQNEPSFLAGLDIDHHVLDRNRPIVDADVPDGDVVIATWYETAEWAASLSPSKGARVYFLQGYDAASGHDAERVDATWQLPMRKIVVSRWLADLAEQKFGDTSAVLVPNSVDTRQFNAPPRGKQQKPTVGTMYSIKPYRGCADVFAAFEQVRQSIPDLQLCCFGIGPEDRQALPLPDGCEYHELPSQDKLATLYSRCDAWLSCPQAEGFGLPILEASACRTPVIASRAGAAPELLAQGGGVLVDAGDVDQIAAAIERIVMFSEEQWAAMSDRAYQTATSYTWDDATDRFEQALVDAVEAENHQSTPVSAGR